jgi:hypothetical protein
MARIRKGTQSLGNGKVMIKTNSAKGVRKIRCMRCKNLVAPSQGNDGKPVYRCICGRSFRSTTM